MGFFKTKEEKEISKQKHTMYLGESLQPIGKIPVNGVVGITLKPDNKVLNIHHDKTDITLPYDRIVSFKAESETTLLKAGNSLSGALLGGAIGGGVGAIIGAGKNKGKTDIKWVSTLTYKDKDGEVKELNFIDYGLTGHYKGECQNFAYAQFSNTVNKISSNLAEDITEL